MNTTISHMKISFLSKLKMTNVKCQMNVCLEFARHVFNKIIIPSFLICHLSFVILSGAANATTLYRVRFAYFPKKIRAVFDFDGAFSYQTQKAEKEIVIYFRGAKASYQIEQYLELNDLIVKYFEIEKEEKGLKVTIPLAEAIEYDIFHLNTPPRLVIDFDREFLNVVSGGIIADGIEYLKIKKGSPKGNLQATVLRIDPGKAEIEPSLAKKFKPNLLESFVDFLSPWRIKMLDEKHFFLDNVKNIVAENNALAGINGTFFARSGSPLGALVIHGELVSYPIYDRTALIIDKNENVYIDTVFITSYFKIGNGLRHKITGINQGRGDEDIIIYTTAWGQTTGTNTQGIELVIEKSEIKEVNSSNSKIPKNGYVLSISDKKAQFLEQKLKPGAWIETEVKTVPYATSPDKIVHLVSGGPRLLKNGRTYVSKHEEKFRADVAKRRAARTAVGITDNGELIFVTVEKPSNTQISKTGKYNESIGATLEELSSLMQSLGAVEAMNLDGGSSTTMVIKDKTVCGNQRKVSNAILVRPKN